VNVILGRSSRGANFQFGRSNVGDGARVAQAMYSYADTGQPHVMSALGRPLPLFYYLCWRKAVTAGSCSRGHVRCSFVKFSKSGGFNAWCFWLKIVTSVTSDRTNVRIKFGIFMPVFELGAGDRRAAKLRNEAYRTAAC